MVPPGGTQFTGCFGSLSPRGPSVFPGGKGVSVSCLTAAVLAEESRSRRNRCSDQGEIIVGVGKIRPGGVGVGGCRKLALSREKCCSAFNGKENQTTAGGRHSMWQRLGIAASLPFLERHHQGGKQGLGLLWSRRGSLEAGGRGLAQLIHWWGVRQHQAGGCVGLTHPCGDDPMELGECLPMGLDS